MNEQPAQLTIANESYEGHLGYIWHWWINSLPKDGPAGDPHERKLYGFKSMLGALGYFEAYLRMAFTDSLPRHHQQCSFSPVEPLAEKNVVCCALGKTVTECPILLSLKDSFTDSRDKHYKGRVPDEGLYELMAKTCAWHMLSSEMLDGVMIDWNEGAMQTTSDRMFWDRVYESLASPTPPLTSGEEA